MKKMIDSVQGFAGKRVLVRCNFDVPIEDGRVMDTTRIENAVETIKLLRANDCRVVLVAHHDRPDGKCDQEKSLKPVVLVLEKLLGEAVGFVEYSLDLNGVVLGDAPIQLVENLRFWGGEETNDEEFAKVLAGWGDVYVNEAFANSHREHASIVGVAKLLPSFAGVALAKEIEILERVRTNPEKPLVVVIGGAKLETKEPLIGAFVDTADKILVGGKCAVDLRDKSEVAKNVMIADVVDDRKDITKESADNFADEIKKAETVIWNGSMGVFEEEAYQTGTKIVAEAVNKTEAFTVVGGGDTETALTILKMETGIDFISSGGGAMLTFLSEGKLVGLEALK